MNRDQRLIAVFAAIAVVAGGVVAAAATLDRPPPVAVVSRDVPLGPDGKLTLQFVGDVMLGDEVQHQIDLRGTGYDWPFEAVRASTSAADFVMAVSATPITTVTERWDRTKSNSYSSRPESAAALARAGVDAVSLANEHSFDSGPQGLSETIANLDAVGIASVGAGLDRARAEQPLLIRTEVGTIGVVAIGENFGHRATEDAGGTLVMDPSTVRRSAWLAREAGADWVVAFVHWGDNYAPINSAQRASAGEFAAAGYDMVVGSGPHSAQPIEFIGAMPVAYSVGNFVFGTRGQWAGTGVPGLGLVVELELAPAQTPPRLTARCIVTDNLAVDFQPRPCDPAQTQAFLPTLHPQVRVEGDVGVLPCVGCFADRRGRR
jgi:hypothetical protein